MAKETLPGLPQSQQEFVENLIEEKIKEAQKKAEKAGYPYTPEQTVIVCADGKTYLFLRKEEDNAIVKIPASSSPTGKDIIKTFPLKGTFNALEAMNTTEDTYVRATVATWLKPDKTN